MKKEKGRNMSSAKAGAHELFVVLSIGEGGGVYEGARVVWGDSQGRVAKPRQGQDDSLHSSIVEIFH